MVHVTDLSSDILAKVFDSTPELHASVIRQTCKAFYAASYGSRSLFESFSLKIFRGSNLTHIQNVLREISVHNVISRFAVECTHHAFETIFVRPLNLSHLSRIVLVSDSAINALDVLESLGCVNVRNILMRAPRISSVMERRRAARRPFSIHYVQWHTYEKLRHLHLESFETMHLARGTEIPQVARSLTLRKISTVHPAIFTLRNLRRVELDLGTEPFVLPRRADLAWKNVESLAITASSVPMNISPMESLLYFSWTVTGNTASEVVVPQVTHNKLEKVHIAGPTWIREAEIYDIRSLAFTIRLEMTDLAIPFGAYSFTVDFLSLNIVRVTGTENVDYTHLQDSVVEVLELPLKEIDAFVRDMNNRYPQHLRKVVVVAEHDVLLEDESIQAVRQLFPQRIGIVGQRCFHNGFFDE
jgi:hypothetical protein